MAAVVLCAMLSSGCGGGVDPSCTDKRVTGMVAVGTGDDRRWGMLNVVHGPEAMEVFQNGAYSITALEDLGDGTCLATVELDGMVDGDSYSNTVKMEAR